MLSVLSLPKPASRLIWGVLLILMLGHFRTYLHAAPADFRAFYAAGKVVVLHGDPYRVQPLLDVEQSLSGQREANEPVIPAPLPPFALVLFACYAALPLKVATLLLAVMLMLTTAAIGVLISRCSSLPLPVACAAAYFGCTYSAVTWGQVAPFALAALGWGWFYANRERWLPAAALLAAALIQPQFAAPAAIAAMIMYPRLRVSLIASTAIVLALGFGLGPKSYVEYLSTLSIHGGSEVYFPAQYSLTWLLGDLNVSEAVSIGVGRIVSGALLILTFLTLWRQRKRKEWRNVGLLFVAAVAEVSGIFVHLHQLAVILLLALLVLRPKQAPRLADRALMAMIVVCFLAPFDSTESPKDWHNATALVSIVAGFATSWGVMNFWIGENARKLERLIPIGLVSFAAIYTLMLLKLSPIYQAFQGPIIRHLGSENASIEWKHYNEAFHLYLQQQPHYPLFEALVKAPVWVGSLLAIFYVIRMCSTSRRDLGSGVQIQAPVVAPFMRSALDEV